MTAFALAGRLTFDPRKDPLIGADGKPFMLKVLSVARLMIAAQSADRSCRTRTAMSCPLAASTRARTRTSRRPRTRRRWRSASTRRVIASSASNPSLRYFAVIGLAARQVIALTEPVERQGLHRLPGADQGQGQVHDGPHQRSGPVAQVPRPPRQHLQ